MMSFNRVSCPRSMIACHDRRRLTVCAHQRLWWQVTPDIDRLCVLSKGYAGMPSCVAFKCYRGMPCSICTDRLYRPKEMLSSHARRHSIVYVIQGWWWHSTPHIVRLCVYLMAMIIWHAWFCSTVCYQRAMMKSDYCIQDLRWHAMPDVVWACVPFKGP